ncbi:leucyl aminopeptidase family protein [Micromonospora matsumotoense]|uniref:leucyl aminopeptidase family protein n=1 Tax=Micromonospora matsumotoense TaxID=121616 RepID=UPI00340FDDBD
MIVTPVADARPADVVALPWHHGTRPGTFALRRGFTGRAGQVVAEPGPDGRMVLLNVGLGPAGTATPATFRRAAAAAVRAAGPARTLRLDLAETTEGPVSAGARARAVAEGAVLAAYRYDRHRYGAAPPPLGEITIRTAHPGAVAEGVAVADAVCLARDLVNSPGGELGPTEFGRRVTGIAGGALSCVVHHGEALHTLGMAGLLAVARGSAEPPCLVELRYDPATPGRRVTLVGKGITFDSGGLCLKSPPEMRAMKADMGGAAAVVGAVSAVAALRLPVGLRALIPLAENMPGPAALRPGDVVRHADGTTTEVLNTDNEGRVVLADALLLARDPAPDVLIDVATLTAAVPHALGARAAAYFARDDSLAAEVSAAAARSDESFWRLPLWESERRHLRSSVADRVNAAFRPGDAIQAALFLREFVGPRLPWVHVDLGAAAFNDEAAFDETPHGGTGFGVRTLVEFLRGPQ